MFELLAGTDDKILDSSTVTSAENLKIYWCLMMANEEKNIRNCLTNLSSLTDGGVISDNGSTDNSISLARKVASELEKPCVIESTSWKNYMWNRNQAILMMDEFLHDRIKERTGLDTRQPMTISEMQFLDSYPSYMLVTDLDNVMCWSKDNVEKFNAFHKKGKGEEDEEEPLPPLPPIKFDKTKLVRNAYWVESRRGFVYKTLNLVKLDPLGVYKWWYNYTLHEQLDHRNIQNRVNPGTVTGIYNFYGLSGGRGRDPVRLEKEYTLLKMNSLLYPNDFRSQFYMAQTLEEFGEEFLEAILKLYEQVAKNHFDLDHRYVSLIRMANLIMRYKPKQELRYLRYLERAYELPVRRLEAVYNLVSHHNGKGHFRLAWALGAPYIDMPVEFQNSLFLDEAKNRFMFHFEMGVVGYHAGHHKEAIDLMKRVIRSSYTFEPVREQCIANLKNSGNLSDDELARLLPKSEYEDVISETDAFGSFKKLEEEGAFVML